jgi:hypothetical protein
MSDPRQYATPCKSVKRSRPEIDSPDLSDDEDDALRPQRKRRAPKRFDEYVVDYKPFIEQIPDDLEYGPFQEQPPLAHSPVQLDYDSINIPPIIYYPFSSKAY